MSLEIIKLLIVPFFFLIIFGFCVYIIKRRWIDKKPFSAGVQFSGEYVYTQFQNKDKKRAIEHVHYMHEDKEKEDDEGDDLSRFHS